MIYDLELVLSAMPAPWIGGEGEGGASKSKVELTTKLTRPKSRFRHELKTSET